MSDVNGVCNARSMAVNCGGCLELFEAHSYSADRSCAQQARRGVVLDFAKRALAAGWACFALSFVNDLTCFDLVCGTYSGCSLGRFCAQRAHGGVVLYFTKRVLAAAWARFAPNAVVDLKGFGSAKRILAAVWAGFAPSGLVEVRGWIRPKRALAAVWVGFARSPCRENARFESATRALAAAWARFAQNSTKRHAKSLIGVRL